MRNNDFLLRIIKIVLKIICLLSQKKPIPLMNELNNFMYCMLVRSELSVSLVNIMTYTRRLLSKLN